MAHGSNDLFEFLGCMHNHHAGGPLEVAHIYPLRLRQRDKLGLQSPVVFLNTLRCGWSDDKISAWKDAC